MDQSTSILLARLREGKEIECDDPLTLGQLASTLRQASTGQFFPVAMHKSLGTDILSRTCGRVTLQDLLGPGESSIKGWRLIEPKGKSLSDVMVRLILVDPEHLEDKDEV